MRAEFAIAAVASLVAGVAIGASIVNEAHTRPTRQAIERCGDAAAYINVRDGSTVCATGSMRRAGARR